MTADRLTYAYRRAGLDHNWFEHEPTHRRQRVTWPDNKHIALWIVVPVEFFPLDASSQPIRPLGGLDRAYPDFWSYSNRDYGTRIGIYRIMRVLDGLGLRATATVNSAMATRYPRVVNEIVRRGWEIACGGVDMGHIHHGKLSLDVERALIQSSRDALEKASGQSIIGWHSPGHSQSSNTPLLLAEEGFRYVTDWVNDDMPYAMNTGAGSLVAMPLTYEWSDRVLLVHHSLTVDEYERQVVHAFQRLLSEAKKQRSGRILSVSISPWILGYPHRIAVLERMLKKVLDGGPVWNATGKEIVHELIP